MAVILTPEQQRVIEHRDGHLQVVACAGSGKTEAISRRVAVLIEQGAAPDSIVAFTFTERAASELKERVVQRVRDVKGAEFLDRLGPMFVGTIHSYCLRLIQDHVPEYGNFDLLDPHRQAGLVSRESKRLGLERLGPRHWQPIRDFLRNADVIENELIDPAELAGTPIGDCYAAYADTLRRYRLATFGQLISLAVAALESPMIFQAVHGPLRHLIVDEYQDINPAQERLIGLLATAPVQLCVVGDDDQAIYQWRGSDVDNIQQFAERYAPAVRLTLATNRRSRPGIVGAATAFAHTISPRLPKEMHPHREAGRPEVTCWSAATEPAEAEAIADAIQKLRDRGFRYAEVAVLFRSVRTSAPPLIDALRARGIPLRCAGRTGLFLQPEISVLARTYAWLLDYDWQDERYGQPAPVTLEDLLSDYRATFGEGRAIPDLDHYLRDWKKEASSKARPVNLVADFYRLLRLLGAHELSPDDPAQSARLGALARFSNALADFESVTRRGRNVVDEGGGSIYRGGMDRGKEYYQRLYNYLQHYARDAYEDFEGEERVELDAVDILTIHQAKGLEWPIVFVPALVEGRFPSRRSGQAQPWLLPADIFPADARARYEGSETEERRLFYVAMTRARDSLYLSRFEKRKNRFRPSRFLTEVAGGVPPTLATLPLPAAPSGAALEKPPSLAVSFSDLALYEECPHLFRMQSVYGFQTQLAIELGYGRAIHHVLRRVADLAKERGRPPSLAEAEALLVEAFYLPYANRPAHDRLLAAAQRLVGRYLTHYADDLRRVWATERPFELHLEGGTVAGRADVILDREDGREGALAIVDYKTATDDRADSLFAFQLQIYAAAARGEGLAVEATYLHQLADGERRPIDSQPATTLAARSRAQDLLSGVRSASYPPRPEPAKCRRCDVRAVCRHAACRAFELHDA